MKESIRINNFPGLENHSVHWFDPGDIYDSEEFGDNPPYGDQKLWLVSFGGSYWPLFYVVPSEKHCPSHMSEIEQAISALLDTPEGKLHLMLTDEDFDENLPSCYVREECHFQEGWNNEGWYAPDTVELVRELSEEETKAAVEMIKNLPPQEEAE